MKIVFCGKNNAAVQCLEFLAGQADEVWAIGTFGDDGKDGWQRSLKAAAHAMGVSFGQPANINEPSFVARLAAFEPRILVSIQYDQILRDALFSTINCPCLNLHFSLLPRNRGVAPVAWAVINGDRETGATLHHMTKDIDAGDLVADRTVPIDAGQTARDVYDAISAAAVELFEECYPFTDELLATRLRQDRSQASYHANGAFDFSYTRIDWNLPSVELHRRIRSLIFPPFQYPQFAVNGRLVDVRRIAAELGPATTAPPGVVVAHSPAAMDVAAVGGMIRIIDLGDPNGESMSSGASVNLADVGTLLQ